MEGAYESMSINASWMVQYQQNMFFIRKYIFCVHCRLSQQDTSLFYVTGAAMHSSLSLPHVLHRLQQRITAFSDQLVENLIIIHEVDTFNKILSIRESAAKHFVDTIVLSYQRCPPAGEADYLKLYIKTI